MERIDEFLGVDSKRFLLAGAAAFKQNRGIGDERHALPLPRALRFAGREEKKRGGGQAQDRQASDHADAMVR